MSTSSHILRTTVINTEDFRRLEYKVDEIVKVLSKIVLVEERQSNQGQRITENEKSIAVLYSKHDDLEKTVTKWINRGIGIWGVAVFLFTLIGFYLNHFKFGG